MPAAGSAVEKPVAWVTGPEPMIDLRAVPMFRRLVSWYDGLDSRPDDERVELLMLDRIVRDLHTLPPFGGVVGWAVDAIAHHPDAHTPDELVSAIDALRVASA